MIIEKKAVSRPQERFNYLHSSLRNVIERCFGVPFSYSQGHALFLVEAEIALACCVIKNFIRAEPLARGNLFSEDACDLIFYDSNGVEGASYISRA